MTILPGVVKAEYRGDYRNPPGCITAGSALALGLGSPWHKRHRAGASAGLGGPASAVRTCTRGAWPEAQRLGLVDMLLDAGVAFVTRGIGYDESIPSDAAEARARNIGTIIPGVPGGLGVGHPTWQMSGTRLT